MNKNSSNYKHTKKHHGLIESLCLTSSTHDSSDYLYSNKTAPMMVQVYRDRPLAGTASEDVLSHTLAERVPTSNKYIQNTTTCYRPASSLPDIDIDSLSRKFKNQNHLSEASPSAVYQETSSLSGPCHLSRNARQFHQ